MPSDVESSGRDMEALSAICLWVNEHARSSEHATWHGIGLWHGCQMPGMQLLISS